MLFPSKKCPLVHADTPRCANNNATKRARARARAARSHDREGELSSSVWGSSHRVQGSKVPHRGQQAAPPGASLLVNTAYNADVPKGPAFGFLNYLLWGRESTYDLTGLRPADETVRCGESCRCLPRTFSDWCIVPRLPVSSMTCRLTRLFCGERVVLCCCGLRVFVRA